MKSSAKLLLALSLSLSFYPLHAQDQNALGTGNQQAVELATKSPTVQHAYHFLVAQAKKIHNQKLRKETLDALSNPQTCIRHRTGLTMEDKEHILQNLVQAGLADPNDQTTIPGGMMAGVFPPVLDDGTACPHLPQQFFSAPGGEFGGHHSYPGGLPIHEANNEIAAMNLAREYQAMYGKSQNPGKVNGEGVLIDSDVVIATPMWHDWAKTLVFQWNHDGTEFQELNFGGNGAADNNGNAGNSKTGAHHILGLAESMKRGLDPVLVIAQASAHATPTLGNEFKVVNWLRAAAMIAQIDPVEKGYLVADKHGRLRLPPVRKLGSIDLLNADPSQTNLLAEYTIVNLSDADFTFSVPSITTVQIILRELAPEFGFGDADAASYNNHFRNPALSFLTAERLLMIYSRQGLDGVRKELQKLRDRNVLH